MFVGVKGRENTEEGIVMTIKIMIKLLTSLIPKSNGLTRSPLIPFRISLFKLNAKL